MPQSDSSGRNNKNIPEHNSSGDLGWEEKEILITVKTYPSISKKYDETVCTAGVTRDGEWIRLYPLEFRKMPYKNWFKKYQWIKVKAKKHEKDFRLESYRPDPDFLTLGEHWDTSKNDKKQDKRKSIMLPTVYRSMEEILDKYDEDKVSLGIFKPKKIIDFIAKPDTSKWKPSQEQKLNQLRLFGDQPKNLEKIPFKFSYKFICDDKRCKGHTISIHDWELFQLYRNVRDGYGYAIDEILGKVKKRFFDDMWNDKRDSYLIVGSVYPKRTFIVLGVFWPPK